MIIHKSNVENITRIRVTHFKYIDAIMHSVSNLKATHNQYRFNLIFQ